MIDNNPLVSIVCTTYNHQDYIKETLDSFLFQKINFPIEIIVHDDASTDFTPQIIKEYEQKYPELFVCIYREKNWYSQGKDIWGYLFSTVARGKYIALCEGDDYWTDPFKLQKQVDFLEKNDDYGMVYTKANIYNESLSKIVGTLGESINFEGLLKGYNVVPTMSICLKKELLDKYIEEIESAQKGWLIGDYPLCLYFFSKMKVKFLDDVTGVYRILQESASHSKDKSKLLPYYDSIFEIKKYFYNRMELNDNQLLDFMHFMHFRLLVNVYIEENTYLLKKKCLNMLPLISNIKSFKKYFFIMCLYSVFFRMVYKYYLRIYLQCA